MKTPDDFGMIIDCGASDIYKPFAEIIKPQFLPLLDRPQYNNKRHPLAQVIVSHPHYDHCSEIQEVITAADPLLLTTPHSNPNESDFDMHVNWSIVLESNKQEGRGTIEFLKEKINHRSPPLRAYLSDLPTAVADFEMRLFYIKPSICEKELPKVDYTNNLSIVVHLRKGENSIHFMGDLMPSGCEYLLETNDDFRIIVSKGISILVVPHHGLESGFCQSLFDCMPHGKVRFVNIISEKTMTSENQGKVDSRYQSSTHAGGYKGRYSLSTKNDGTLFLILGAGNKLEIHSNWQP
ncbi:MAG: hypothetical protein AB1690_13700 [Candidatus Zixiibacteriota bacterium]